MKVCNKHITLYYLGASSGLEIQQAIALEQQKLQFMQQV